MTANVNLLPKYSKGEEINNSISHFLGAIFAIITMFIFIIINIKKEYSFLYMLPFYIYSLFMYIMFFVSGLYHSRPFNSKSRAITRIIDHSDIYAFVAATYFPICMVGISNVPVRYTLLIIEVSLGLIGIILNLLPYDTRLITVITFIIYIVQGWIIIFFYPFNIGLPFINFLFILLGGIIYSLGSVMYGVGRYKKYSHTVFHYFVLIAAILQFIGIYFLL